MFPISFPLLLIVGSPWLHGNILFLHGTDCRMLDDLLTRHDRYLVGNHGT
jgi:hypothetical protein